MYQQLLSPWDRVPGGGEHPLEVRTEAEQAFTCSRSCLPSMVPVGVSTAPPTSVARRRGQARERPGRLRRARQTPVDVLGASLAPLVLFAAAPVRISPPRHKYGGRARWRGFESGAGREAAPRRFRCLRRQRRP
jgi:hypothetical protein